MNESRNNNPTRAEQTVSRADHYQQHYDWHRGPDTETSWLINMVPLYYWFKPLCYHWYVKI